MRAVKAYVSALETPQAYIVQDVEPSKSDAAGSQNSPYLEDVRQQLTRSFVLLDTPLPAC